MNRQGQLFGGNWTERKLTILAKYLDAYNTALKKQPFTRVYVDAFAGTGYREQKRLPQHLGFFTPPDPDAERFCKGSARRALELEHGFHRYIFVENDEEKVRELKKLQCEYLDKSVRIIPGEANAAIASYCESEQWRSVRAVMFLDPFATEVKWTTIQRIAATRGVDLWYLFPLMAVNRLLARNLTKALNPPPPGPPRRTAPSDERNQISYHFTWEVHST